MSIQRALIVEDDVRDADRYQLALRKCGIVDALVTKNGFLGLIEISKIKPSVIVLELATPIFSGIQMLRILRQNRQFLDMRFIAITRWDSQRADSKVKCNTLDFNE